jgi:hypothetical protein
MMRFWTISAIAAGLVAAVVVVLSATPEAQAQSRQYVRGDSTVIYYTDEFGRRRTRIILQKRSFLDAGTEVKPGERKFTDYAFPPGYSAIETVLGADRSYSRQPFNGPFDVPYNPRYW